jgi:alkylation response protein AidB-like acyl-CoA dehydrogenase
MSFSASAPQPEPSIRHLPGRLERIAAPADADGRYPQAAMELLVREGLTRPESLVPVRLRGSMGQLLRVPASVGQGDASVGRLLEGHANALELLVRVAPAPLRTGALQKVRDGALYGVWGADPPENALRAEFDGGRYRLSGAKLFCSGVDGLDAALVLAAADGDRRLLLFIPIDDAFEVDRSAWRPLGMRASGSHRVVFDGVTVGPEAVVCDGAAYLAEPWFSGGAMRFAAVQAGVARGLAEVAAAHLVERERADAPHQAARLGAAAVALIGLEGTLARAAAAWDAGCAPDAPASAAAAAAAHGHLARVAAERALIEVADLVQRAVGLGGLIAPHPLERRLRDALTYVRQPNPDGAREAAGRAFVAGHFAAPEP